MTTQILDGVHVGIFCSNDRETNEKKNIIAIHSTPDIWDGDMWLYKEDAINLRDALTKYIDDPRMNDGKEVGPSITITRSELAKEFAVYCPDYHNYTHDYEKVQEHLNELFEATDEG